MAGQLIVELVIVPIVGGVLSITDIVWDAVALLPQPSIAVHVRLTE